MKQLSTENTAGDGNGLERLLAGIEPRLGPEHERKEQIYAELKSEWQATSARSHSKRRRVALAIAATVVIAAFVVLQFHAPDAVKVLPDPDAVLARVSGADLSVNGQPLDDAARSTYRFKAGDRIRTGPDTQVAIRWKATASVRVGATSDIELVNKQHVRVNLGDVYVDSGTNRPVTSPIITIDTPIGTIQHTGTQFIVHVARSGVLVGVREGSVKFSSGTSGIDVTTGQSAMIDADMHITMLPLSAADKRWQWVSSVAPPMNVDGLSTLDIVQWIAHETGRSVGFDSAAAKDYAANDHLRGLGELDPVRALAILPLATGLDFKVDEYTIQISKE